MYEAYFTRRLIEALTLADEATSAEERSAYLRASRYYRDLLASVRRSMSDVEAKRAEP